MNEITGQQIHEAYRDALADFARERRHEYFVRANTPVKDWKDVVEAGKAVYNQMATILNTLLASEEAKP